MLSTDAFGLDARLPGEIALSEKFGVSRPVLRQALERLRSEGRLYARKGSGNYVGDPGPPVQAISFGPLRSIPDVRGFLDFRCSIEGEAAARAAKRCDKAEVAEIHACRLRMEEAIRHGLPAIDEDIAFHTSIARASGNRFFAMTMSALIEQTRFSIRLVRDLSGRPAAARFEEIGKEHAEIDQAIAAGDAEGARHAMTAHLMGGIARLFER